MKPHADLPGIAQGGECRAVIALQCMIGVIARDPHLGEELIHLIRQDAVLTKSLKQVVLTFLLSRFDAHAGCEHHRQRLGQLAEFQQARIWVIGEVALSEHPQAQQLLIVLAQMGEIADQVGRSGHEGDA